MWRMVAFEEEIVFAYSLDGVTVVQLSLCSLEEDDKACAYFDPSMDRFMPCPIADIVAKPLEFQSWVNEKIQAYKDWMNVEGTTQRT